MEDLKIKKSKYGHGMSYNEWAETFNVGSGYVTKPELFEKNVGCGIKPVGVANYINETKLERFFRILTYKLK